MVLELKVPHDTSIGELLKLLPLLLSYVLSFVLVSIYWINHHYLIHLELIYKVDIKDAKRVVINRMREEWIIASETSE
jgi:uncharacterized membrane protein